MLLIRPWRGIVHSVTTSFRGWSILQDRTLVDCTRRRRRTVLGKLRAFQVLNVLLSVGEVACVS